MSGSHLQYTFDPEKTRRYIVAILGFCVLRNIFIFRFKNINASAGFGAGGPKVPYTRELVLYACLLDSLLRYISEILILMYSHSYFAYLMIA